LRERSHNLLDKLNVVLGDSIMSQVMLFAASGGHSIVRGAQILDVHNPPTFKHARRAQAKRRQRQRKSARRLRV